MLASLVSTSTTPLAARYATVLPPAPGIMNRFSVTFWIMPTPGAGPRPAAGAGAGCWAFTVPHVAAATLAATISPSTNTRFILVPPRSEPTARAHPYLTRPGTERGSVPGHRPGWLAHPPEAFAHHPALGVGPRGAAAAHPSGADDVLHQPTFTSTPGSVHVSVTVPARVPRAGDAIRHAAAIDKLGGAVSRNVAVNAAPPSASIVVVTGGKTIDGPYAERAVRDSPVCDRPSVNPSVAPTRNRRRNRPGPMRRSGYTR